VPTGLRGLLRFRRQRIILRFDGGEVAVSEQLAGETEQPILYQFESDSDSVQRSNALAFLSAASERAKLVLRLPGELALKKTLLLPTAAEENLHDILGFEMDRQTPFTAEQVYYDQYVRGRDPQGQQIEVDMVVVPRRVVDEWLGKLGNWGIAPKVVDVDDEDVAQPINLLPAGLRSTRKDLPTRLPTLLRGLALALLAGLAIVPFVQLSRGNQQLQAWVKEAKQRAEGALKVQEQLDGFQKEASLLIEKKRSQVPAIEVINELTRLLPDDSWLYQLSLKGSGINIQGESSGATALLNALESSRLFSKASFRSPVTQNARTSRERFDIAVEFGREKPK
jgi:general secretion pathway protein L